MQAKMNCGEMIRAVSVELKYCERCGGLWLRPSGTDEVYCAPCAQRMAELPAPSARIRSPRMHVNRGFGWRGQTSGLADASPARGVV